MRRPNALKDRTRAEIEALQPGSICLERVGAPEAELFLHNAYGTLPSIDILQLRLSL
jgi:hypothetical protein